MSGASAGWGGMTLRRPLGRIAGGIVSAQDLRLEQAPVEAPLTAGPRAPAWAGSIGVALRALRHVNLPAALRERIARRSRSHRTPPVPGRRPERARRRRAVMPGRRLRFVSGEVPVGSHRYSRVFRARRCSDGSCAQAPEARWSAQLRFSRWRLARVSGRATRAVEAHRGGAFRNHSEGAARIYATGRAAVNRGRRRPRRAVAGAPALQYHWAIWEERR